MLLILLLSGSMGVAERIPGGCACTRGNVKRRSETLHHVEWKRHYSRSAVGYLENPRETGTRIEQTRSFWGAPDFTNAWIQLMRLQVDYLNTDSIKALSDFLRKMPANSYKNKTGYKPYQPTFQHDGVDKPVKNILLFIGDGTGLAQLYAGYTANQGALNVFSMRNIGFSKTSSYDSYVTDSAPGSTAMASGVKNQ